MLEEAAAAAATEEEEEEDRYEKYLVVFLTWIKIIAVPSHLWSYD